jgi:hypothetical protein
MTVGTSRSRYLTAKDRSQSETFPGQRHFAVAGTLNRCGDCQYYNAQHRCDEAIRTSSQGLPRTFPKEARACKYFAKRPRAQWENS